MDFDESGYVRCFRYKATSIPLDDDETEMPFEVTKMPNENCT